MLNTYPLLDFKNIPPGSLWTLYRSAKIAYGDSGFVFAKKALYLCRQST